MYPKLDTLKRKGIIAGSLQTVKFINILAHGNPPAVAHMYPKLDTLKRKGIIAGSLQTVKFINILAHGIPPAEVR
jgi:DNA-binding PadR family transcriptional regulator